MLKKLHQYVSEFNRTDEEIYIQAIPNSKAAEFLAEQVPLLDCPDKDLERTYYFRWWTFRKHIKNTERGPIVTEFLPNVGWSGPYNSINCPACFHIREGRWLRDPDGILQNYIDFWLNNIGNADVYSAWYPHAVMEYCIIKDDYDFGIARLPQMIDFFEKREKKQKKSCGLYWSHDGYDGMELSISGYGLRPTVNSYAYGDALAISQFADMQHNEATYKLFSEKAKAIKKAMDYLLWDSGFYKVMPLEEDQDYAGTFRPEIRPENNAKELLGYIPWYFCLPEEDKAAAFAELLKADGFLAPFGFTTAEQRHPRFLYEHPHECLWNGYVWPFATSQTLVAVANLLRHYQQTVITKNDYYQMLKQYAKSHFLTKADGTIVPWIDENMHPFSGKWSAREVLESQNWPDHKGGYERGKDYNHSLFCDLILSGLFGISVKEGAFVAEPLIPETWEYFKVDNLYLKGKRYCVTYDKYGTHYGKGSGLMVQEVYNA